MRPNTCFVLAVLCVACGADSPPTLAEQIQGEWAAPTGIDGCTEILKLDAERMRGGVVCLGGDGTGRAEVHEGPYTLNGDALEWLEDTSSCPPPATPPLAANVSVVEGELHWRSPEGTVIYARIPTGPTGGGGAAFGCFSEDLSSFTPHPEARL